MLRDKNMLKTELLLGIFFYMLNTVSVSDYTALNEDD